MSSRVSRPEADGHAIPAERAAHGGAEPPHCMLLKLLTPDGQVYDGAVCSITLTAEGGVMEVLPDHAPLMTPLETAIMSAGKQGGGEAGPFAVHGGFLEVRGSEVRVLADAAEAAGGVDVERARASADRARERLAGGFAGRGYSDEIDRDRAECSLRRALVRIKLAGRASGSSR